MLKIILLQNFLSSWKIMLSDGHFHFAEIPLCDFIDPNHKYHYKRSASTLDGSVDVDPKKWVSA